MATAPPSVAKNAILGAGTAVPNFRDLADGTAGALAPGRLYRSAAPSLAHGADAARILGELRVRTFIDLRSVTEAGADDASAPLPSRLSAARARVLRLPLVDDRKVAPVLFRLMPAHAQVRLLCCLPCLGRAGATRLVASHGLSRLGLLGLYAFVIDSSAERLLAALDAVLDAVEADDGNATLIHCSAGKDRTGVLAALILSACGVPRNAIVEQYTRTEHWHDELRGGLGALAKGLGGGAQGYILAGGILRAPAATMEALLDHIDDGYGSARAYLARIGFGADKQARLRAALAPRPAPGGASARRRPDGSAVAGSAGTSDG